MAIPPITVTKPQSRHLTREWLLSQGLTPIILGCDSDMRFQALDDTDAYVSLSGASVEMVFTAADGTVVTLSTANLISGSTYEIKIDTDQSAEDVTNPNRPTGKGWYQVNFSSNSTYTTKLSVAQGRGTYAINITDASGLKKRHFSGEYDIL